MLLNKNSIPKAEREWFSKFSLEVSSVGGTAFLVGGSVRDLVLNEPIHELDVEVFDLTKEKLEQILSKMGHYDPVGKVYGIYKIKSLKIDIGLPREEIKSGLGHRAFDTNVSTRMTIKDASSRRDFSINAIYYNFRKEEIIDPQNGLIDLKNKKLRHCSDKFVEDPLRVLRAMQFVARFDLKIADETLAICKEMTSENLSKERFLAEWEKLILKGKTPSRGLRFLKECGWIKYYPELAALINCPQDPKWHPEGDVWNHTLHCMDAFANNRTGNEEEDLIVGLAVLCHDMGKPETTTRDRDRIRALGHELSGVTPTHTFCERIGIKKSQIFTVGKLVETHMRPHQLFKQKSGATAIRRLARDVERIDLLLRVQEADSAGRPPLPANGIEISNWIRAQASSLGIEKRKPKEIIKGRHLIQFGLKPGSHFKEILKKAFEAQIEGEFETEPEGLKWLKKQI